MHYIKVKTVNEILLKSIKGITDFVKEEKQEFLKVMNRLSDEKREEKYQEDKEKLEKLSSRKAELTTSLQSYMKTMHLEKFPQNTSTDCLISMIQSNKTWKNKYSILKMK